MIRVFDHTSADRAFDHTSAEESARHCLILNRLHRRTWVKDIGDLRVLGGLSSHDAGGVLATHPLAIEPHVAGSRKRQTFRTIGNAFYLVC